MPRSLLGSLALIAGLSASATPLAAQDLTCIETGDKNPTTARVVGVVPGAGHIYACEVLRGLGYFVGTLGIVGGGAAASALDCLDLEGDGCGRSFEVALVAAAGLWAWSIYDAGRAARRTNAKRRLRVSPVLTPGWLPARGRERRPALVVGLSLSVRPRAESRGPLF